MLLDEPLIFERGAAGRIGWPVADPPDGGQAVPALPAALQRDDDLAGFPEVSELEVVRHFVRLSQWNYSAATTLYPLGSCTMKYNPVVNEGLARLPGFAALHPLVPETLAQGALELLAALEAALAAVSGLDAVCLQPAAGAHGELLGMLLVRAYHVDRGDARRRVLIPSSAHGTNPASATLCGYEVTEVPVDARGLLSARAVAAAMDESVAALMITNPNTLGLVEDATRSVGRLRALYGNFGILVRAHAYLARLGGPGLAEATRLAVLNANYLRARLRGTYHLPYETPSLHECVFSDRNLQDYDVHTLDVAKRLLDYGFYAPTIYFPLVVKGALMIEPTETEPKETLDPLADALP